MSNNDRRTTNANIILINFIFKSNQRMNSKKIYLKYICSFDIELV